MGYVAMSITTRKVLIRGFESVGPGVLLGGYRAIGEI